MRLHLQKPTQKPCTAYIISNKSGKRHVLSAFHRNYLMKGIICQKHSFKGMQGVAPKLSHSIFAGEQNPAYLIYIRFLKGKI